MTPQEALDRVDDIRRNADEPAIAHRLEDELHVNVLEAIARGADQPALLARFALETGDIEFARYRS